MQMSDLHLAARRLASQGIPVFPCVAASKKPATEKGFHDATTDLVTIDAWWSENPSYNVAFQPQKAGWAVIDPDGDDGIRNWDALVEANGGLAETYTVRTPRGGLHEYYRGDLPPSVNKLGPHIDTRGGGSYVLAPPSRVKLADGSYGSYTVEIDAAPVDLPAWVGEALGKARDKAKAALEELDRPENIARAIAYLKSRPEVVQGNGADAKTYEYACDVLNLGVGPEKAFDLMLEHYKCSPRDERFENFLRTKITNAAAYAQNEPGAWAVEPAADVFGDALDKLCLDDEPDKPARPNRFKLWTLGEIAALPPPSWLIPQMFPDKGLSLLFGPPGSYKSFVAMQLSLELASGMYEGGPKPVIYIGAEGGRGLEQRAAAWKAAHQVNDDVPLWIVQNMPWASDAEMVVEFIEEVKAAGVKPALVVVDTAARMMLGLNENDARDVGKFVQAVDEIKLALDCAVVILHHTGKDASQGARGSIALTAAVDAAFEIKAEKATRALAMRCVRQKDGEERSEPWTYEGRPFAGSLVFFETTAAEHRALTRVDDALAPKKIGQALADLNAFGIENGVTTHVLASSLIPADEEMSEEARAAHAMQIGRILGQRVKGSLEAYCTGSGPALLWYAPTKRA